MKLPSNRTLLIVAVVLIAGWLLLRSRALASAQLPWNRGQAGSIFQTGLQMGGGQ